MFVFYILVTFLEALRALLAYWSANDLSSVIVLSKKERTDLKKSLKPETELSTEIKPSNVYQDLSRQTSIVTMLFVTQFTLIALVCVDLYETDVTSCFDGSENCPVVGTLGSWFLYVVGIMMGLVKKLGANYGQSEMNPAYWLQVFLFGKQKASTFMWFDEINNVTKEANLSFYSVLVRYILSFIINGLGYHIIIHAFPIQAANRYTYIGLLWAG